MENLNDILKMIVPREWLLSMMPVGASAHAHQIDFLYWFLIVSCSVLFLLVVIPLFSIVAKYRRRSFDQRAVSQKDHNFWLESLWTFMPLIYLTVLFVWGFWQYMDMHVAPHNAKELKVIGQKWQWSVDYPLEEISVAGVGAEIAVPVGVPIKLIMASQDVIHSFFIPNLRVKQDVVPGKYSTLWFEADRVGVYPVLCAEYCGDLHSQMLAKIVVMPESEYEEWIEKQKAADQDLPLPELGKKLHTKLGCVACHSLDGVSGIGPSFKGLYGIDQKMTDGTTHKIDDKYIHSKLLEPQKHTALGYAPAMPSFQGRVSEREISGLIEFIKSLSEGQAPL